MSDIESEIIGFIVVSIVVIGLALFSQKLKNKESSKLDFEKKRD